MAEAFADLETPLSLYLKLAHSRDGGKYSFLLESVVGGERFGRYSFIGLPARTLVRASGFGADALTEVVHRRPGGRDRRPATRWTSSRPTRSASRWRCAPACRAFAAAWRATLATTRCATSKRSWKRPARPTRWAARHPAAAVRGAGRHRQPVGQALPDRLCRPGPARGLCQRQEAPARPARAAQVFGQRARSSGKARPSRPSATLPRPTTWPRWSAPRS
jgi:hypothetical protein